MKPQRKILPALIGVTTLAAAVYFTANGNRHMGKDFRSMVNPQALAQQLPTHQTGEAKDGGVVVGLCDGVTKMEVPGLKPGQSMTHEQALAVTHSLMADWERKHPDQHWQMAQQPPAGKAPADSSDDWIDETSSPDATPTAANGAAPVAANSPAAQASPIAQNAHRARPPSPAAANTPAKEEYEEAAGKRARSVSGQKGLAIQQGDTYASFNQRDLKVWQANTDRFVQEGKEVFHDANKLGGTIGVSCDMCHPDAANTHPETYPKYQVQLQRVALLRDMIEWCIENPVKGKTMDPNDERLRASRPTFSHNAKASPSNTASTRSSV